MQITCMFVSLPVPGGNVSKQCASDSRRGALCLPHMAIASLHPLPHVAWVWHPGVFPNLLRPLVPWSSTLSQQLFIHIYVVSRHCNFSDFTAPLFHWPSLLKRRYHIYSSLLSLQHPAYHLPPWWYLSTEKRGCGGRKRAREDGPKPINAEWINWGQVCASLSYNLPWEIHLSIPQCGKCLLLSPHSPQIYIF